MYQYVLSLYVYQSMTGERASDPAQAEFDWQHVNALATLFFCGYFSFLSVTLFLFTFHLSRQIQGPIEYSALRY